MIKNLLTQCGIQKKNQTIGYNKKILSTLTRIGKKKLEDCVNIANRKIDKKPSNLVVTEKKTNSNLET